VASNTDTTKGASPRYLVNKRGFWYRPNSQGYTTSSVVAGRFTLEEAQAIVQPNGEDGPRDGLYFMHEDELRSDEWEVFSAMRAERDALAARVAEMEAVEATPERPAFPLAAPDGFAFAVDGMSLRDYVAAAALPSIIEVVSRGLHTPAHKFEGVTSAEAMVIDAFEIADAFMALSHPEAPQEPLEPVEATPEPQSLPEVSERARAAAQAFFEVHRDFRTVAHLELAFARFEAQCPHLPATASTLAALEQAREALQQVAGYSEVNGMTRIRMRKIALTTLTTIKELSNGQGGAVSPLPALLDASDKLENLMAAASDEDLTDGGRYFEGSCCDLTQCHHSETGNYVHRPDGELIEFLWNNRRNILEAMRRAGS